MKKLICLALALMICFSLAMPAFAYSSSPEEKPIVSTDVPKTGDTILMWVGALAISAVGLSAVIASRKKEQ